MQNNLTPRVTFAFEVVLFALVFVLVNLRSFVFWTLFPPVNFPGGEAWRELPLWIVALFMMFVVLWSRDGLQNYARAWSRQRLVIAFIGFGVLSIAWSGSPLVTIHRVLVLVCASLAAAFLGSQYSLSQIMRVLFWLCAALVIGGLLLIYVNPHLGTDQNHPYNGAWRGLFWHKNHLGLLAPLFCLVFLYHILNWRHSADRIEAVLSAILYPLTLVMLYYSQSVAGYLVAAVLHLTGAAAWIWLRLRDRLRPAHYYGIAIALLACAAFVFLRLDFVLGLMNRNTTFTGRVPLWTYLLKDVFVVRPWLGYGFGSLFADYHFREYLRDLLGWAYPVMIADDGFLDILLNTGVLGLMLFFAGYLQMWIRSVRLARRANSLALTVPVIFMLFTLLANLTYSLFMETEVFVWSVMLCFAFFTARELTSA